MCLDLKEVPSACFAASPWSYLNQLPSLQALKRCLCITHVQVYTLSQRIFSIVPARPPNPPIPNAAELGASAGRAEDAVVAGSDVALLGASWELLLPDFITRWTVRPSFKLCIFRVSWSFRILPAKIRHTCSIVAPNFSATTSLSCREIMRFEP